MFYDPKYEAPTYYKPIETFSMMGCPGIVVNVKHEPVKLLFDTGAQISYLSSRFLTSAPVYDSVEDFSPLLGGESYMVNRHMLPTTFADKTFDVAYGETPMAISMLLGAYGIDGIIGWDLIEKFRIIINKGKFVLPPQGI